MVITLGLFYVGSITTKWFKQNIGAWFQALLLFPFRAMKKFLSVSRAGQVDILDQFRFLGNCPPTPPLS